MGPGERGKRGGGDSGGGRFIEFSVGTLVYKTNPTDIAKCECDEERRRRRISGVKRGCRGMRPWLRYTRRVCAYLCIYVEHRERARGPGRANDQPRCAGGGAARNSSKQQAPSSNSSGCPFGEGTRQCSKSTRNPNEERQAAAAAPSLRVPIHHQPQELLYIAPCSLHLFFFLSLPFLPMSHLPIGYIPRTFFYLSVYLLFIHSFGE